MTSHLILSLTFTPKCAAQWSAKVADVGVVGEECEVGLGATGTTNTSGIGGVSVA